MSHLRLPSSPAPGTPQTGTKAYVVTALALILYVAGQWVSDTGATTPKEVTSWCIQAVVLSGVLGSAAYLTPNRAKR